ncbi:hypothetical protein [Flavobacterium sp. H122]|uniref:hypothetical protein n=1 Tax=Flavobacterium sp. H122 TaxID=2529860 RepID=UPI0010A9B0EB|nr:hypothetical protein [Flavobacterium sp. H122]
MGKFAPAIILYVLSGLIYIVSSLLRYDSIVFVSKPIFATSILFHYWNEAKEYFNSFNFVILLIYFIGDIFNLFEGYFKYVLILNIIVYAMLSYVVVKKILLFRNKAVDGINLVYILLSVVFVLCLVYISVFLVFDKDFEFYYYIVLYSLILSGLSIATTVLYSFSNEKGLVYLMLATYCYLISDVFYIIYYYAYDLILFRMLNMTCNVLSYYFIISYFLYCTNSIEEVDNLNA